MQAFRPALRRVLPAIARRRPPTFRFQHGYNGPHKEYFQTPGQSPLPDTTPYDPKIPIETVAARTGPSRTSRILRSLFWAQLFAVIGGVLGTTLITWEYLQPPFEPGSPEEQELYAEIVETLDTHPLVDQLRSQNWIEEDFYTSRQHSGSNTGMSLVSEKLTGIQGLSIKAFRHPTSNYSMLVFFAGFGVEGWPDVIHGGITTTMILEAAKRHHLTYYSEFIDLDNTGVSVDFKRPMRPGEVYAVLVPPAVIAPAPTQGILLNLVVFVLQLEGAPKLTIQTDATTQAENHNLEIPVGRGKDATHAMGKIQMLTKLKEGATYPMVGATAVYRKNP